MHDIINTTVIICKPCMIPRLQRRHSAVILLRLRLKTSESLGRNIRSMCALGTSGCLHKISSRMCLPICWRSKLAKVCFAAGALQPPGCWSFSRLFQEGGCTVRPSWAGACSRLLPLLCHDPTHAATALMMSGAYSGPPKICPNLLADHLNSCRVVRAPLHQMASSVSP